ncbi:ACT domain-containing protein ACR10-like [Chenopodium quinoa]|uniref:ACT domain-containing protein ACR10-like n=1 Tax=Chenopodium quinoa TaxID=63459 RepID=UPI000B781A12|nr:ACT domain-containing protein ACR10-like [Chenopodium quinoa]
MGILQDDVVIFKAPEKEGDPTVITVNCPDKLGLGCDLCRILLFFGFCITRVDFATDGKWCYIVLWVMGKPTTKWGLVKKRLVAACPSCFSASGISYYRAELLQPPKPPDVFLLKLCCHDRRGLLHDVTEVLCELELNIQRVKVSTTPDGKVLDLFFITDARELLHTKKRQEDTKEHLRETLGDDVMCDIEKVSLEVTACSQASPLLPSAIMDDTFNSEIPNKYCNGTGLSNCASVTIDNTLSPSHTLVQIACQDYRGLLYDLMRTFKDYNIQISYGRGTMKQKKNCEIDLFIMQADGKKIVDPSKQNALRSRLLIELARPLRVSVVSRGPDTELLVANPVEISGRGRPGVFYDVTLALKMLNLCIFSAEIVRHVIEHRECEVYRFLLQEGGCLSVSRNKTEERVWNTLMGWE